MPEGFFFRNEAAILSGKAANPAKREKNPLDAAVTNLTSMRTCFNLGR